MFKVFYRHPNYDHGAFKVAIFTHRPFADGFVRQCEFYGYSVFVKEVIN